MSIKEEGIGELGALIDELESLSYSLSMQLPNEIHVEAMRSTLPVQVQKFKTSFIKITGENPWDHD